MVCVGPWEISIILIATIPRCFIVMLILGFKIPMQVSTFSVQVLTDSYYNLGMEQCIFKNSDNEMYISPIYLVSYNIKLQFLSQVRFLTISLNYGPLVFQLPFHFYFFIFFLQILNPMPFSFTFKILSIVSILWLSHIFKLQVRMNISYMHASLRIPIFKMCVKFGIINSQILVKSAARDTHTTHSNAAPLLVTKWHSADQGTVGLSTTSRDQNWLIYPTLWSSMVNLNHHSLSFLGHRNDVLILQKILVVVSFIWNLTNGFDLITLPIG